VLAVLIESKKITIESNESNRINRINRATRTEASTKNA
jgi:hypothetical protein